MKSLECDILDYYRKLSSYLNGGPYDPGYYPVCEQKKSCNMQTYFVSDKAPPEYDIIRSHFARLLESYPELLSNVIFHGSYGDFTNVSYSDLDFILLVTEDSLKLRHTRKRLRQIMLGEVFPFIYRIDPLQHHGAFWLWPALQRRYCQDILPICVYEKSWAVYPETVELNVMEIERAPRAPRLMELVEREYSYLVAHPKDSYAMKCFLSHIMILPCLYFSDINQHMYKAQSFRPFYERFGGLSRWVRTASRMRWLWPSTKTQLGYFLPLHRLSRVLGPRYPIFIGKAVRLPEDKISMSEFRRQDFKMLRRRLENELL